MISSAIWYKCRSERQQNCISPKGECSLQLLIYTKLLSKSGMLLPIITWNRDHNNYNYKSDDADDYAYLHQVI